ncbi:hypothetical protein AMS68_007305 [Peltaster fructicola]|uniref:Uncharacterized protein n=1 Tax=Peltaster fructicola TaxID=286661 RepID=A0A6H0Y4M1_9PEZI|nr:hypothetical protein AMS68_007305 [Peltaster fructicola]
MDASTMNIVAVAAGVASHVLIFNRYEMHMHGIAILSVYLACSAALPLVLVQLHDLELWSAIRTALVIDASFLAGAYGSTLIYRLFLNPLNRFPGPYAARISSFWWSAQLGKSDAYHKLLALHKKYGKIVRIGSNDLSIIDAAAVEKSFGVGSKVTKASWYDQDSPINSMHTTRDKSLHDRRRKVWAPAFSDKAIRGYEEIISAFNEKLLNRIDEAQGKPFNITHWFNLYSFDVMGSLAFGKQYGMVTSGQKTYELEMLNEGMEPLALMLPAWLMRMLVVIPNMLPGYEKFVVFCRDELAWRVQNDMSRKPGEKTESKPKTGSDILAWILEAYRDVEKPEKEPLLVADTRLIIVAGSDTTAATLTYLFYHLAKNPAVVDRLRKELEPLCHNDWSDKDIKHLAYLNGAINEAMRLHPAVPSGLRRLVPKEGMMVGETFLPGNTEFFMPQFVMGRDSDNYSEPESFLPERWAEQADLIKQKDAFAPFSIGPFGCIGKNLALMQLRTITAQILLKYDVSLAYGEDGHRLLYETKDHFTVALGACDVVFKAVKS